jgi:DNA-binding response OmpR family regulator
VKRILIIKEEANITFSLKQALTDNGFEQVDIFTDPILALRSFKDLFFLVIEFD